MKYKDFKKKLMKHPYFTSAIYGALTPSPQVLHNQVNKWVKEGDVVKLRRGLYTLNDNDRKVGLSKEFLANALYTPSYVSMEYALAYYNMIPEAVLAVTSLSTRKTKTFTNSYGRFIYQNIKKTAFTGFVSVKDEFGLDFLIATPEKALLDFLYFKVPATMKPKDDLFEGSFRLQNLEEINTARLMELADKMESKKMKAITNALIVWIKKEEERCKTL